MLIQNNIPIFGTPEPSAVEQIVRTMEANEAVYGALMADHHKGYGVPIGGVVGYRNAISPSGVGYDIGCGNKAVRLDIPAEEVRANIGKIMDDVWSTISFGVGRKNNEIVEHPIFDKNKVEWTVAPEVLGLKQTAQEQLGTVGSGNHYVDIFVDEINRVWVGVHFGSRGLGHKTATYFLKIVGAKDNMDAAPVVFNLGSTIGQDYLVAMRLAGEYAYAGRDWVCSRVAKLLGANIVEEVHNHHNYAWKEKHFGEDLWVVRKGATPAWPGQKGFVGGSMGEPAVIIEGKDNKYSDSSVQELALFSTVHGAGRVLGRMEAKGKYKNGVCVREPKVDQGEWKGWMERAGVELRGGGLDEAPQCYKRLPEVLKEHEGTISVLHILTPVGVAMAGAREFDPYKD